MFNLLNKKMVCFLALSNLVISTTLASTISLVPGSPSVTLGDQVVLDLNMDFSDDPTLGGGLDIFYNGDLLDFVSYVLDPALGSDPAFSRDPDDLGNKLEGLAFGNFDGLSGPARVGTLTFDTKTQAGTADFTMDVTTNPLVGGFVSEATLQDQFPTFIGTSVEAVVPVPAAVWLFGSGLIGLAGISRRKK